MKKILTLIGVTLFATQVYAIMTRPVTNSSNPSSVNANQENDTNSSPAVDSPGNTETNTQRTEHTDPNQNTNQNTNTGTSGTNNSSSTNRD